MSTTIIFSDDEKSLISKIIDEMFDSCNDIYGAVISSVDGHLKLKVNKKDLPVKKISAMTSSLMALGDAASTETNQGKSQYINIVNEEGIMVIMRTGESLILTILSSGDSEPGKVLSAGKKAGDDIAMLFQKK